MKNEETLQKYEQIASLAKLVKETTENLNSQLEEARELGLRIYVASPVKTECGIATFSLPLKFELHANLLLN